MFDPSPVVADPSALEAWSRDHAHRLTTTDPDAPLDDLAPVRELVEGARVVAIGEGAHFVAEFGAVQSRLLRDLVEACGFEVVALEFGARDAMALAPWLHGEGSDDDLGRIGGTLATAVNGEVFRWTRRWLTATGRRLRVVGLDLPTTFSLRRVLEPVAEHLGRVDAALLPLVDEALAIADRIDGASAALAAPRWAELEPTQRDRLTAVLARLTLRMRALAPLYAHGADPVTACAALRDIEAASHIDYMHAAMHGVYTGADLPGDTTVRERYMADSMLTLLGQLDDDQRVVLISHANHVQKTPIYWGDHLSALPLGYFLGQHLGPAYRSIALTHTASRMPEMVYPDPASEVGFTLTDIDLDPPSPGSIERALLDAGHGDVPTLSDLRDAPPVASLRTQSAELATPVTDAFDAVIATPTATLDPTVTIPLASGPAR